MDILCQLTMPGRLVMDRHVCRGLRFNVSDGGEYDPCMYWEITGVCEGVVYATKVQTDKNGNKYLGPEQIIGYALESTTNNPR